MAENDKDGDFAEDLETEVQRQAAKAAVKIVKKVIVGGTAREDDELAERASRHFRTAGLGAVTFSARAALKRAIRGDD